MIETFAALMVAHVAADYVLQTRWMALNKNRTLPLVAHIATVWVASWICLGFSSVSAVTVLALVHLVMDLVKSRFLGQSGLAYGLDQGVHLLTALAVASAVPGAWNAGIWAAHQPFAMWALMLGVVAAGAVFALRGGFYLVAHLNGAPDDLRPAGPPLSHRALWEGGIFFAGMVVMPLAVSLAGIVRIGALFVLPQSNGVQNGAITRRMGRVAALSWAVGAGLGTHLVLGGLLGLDAADAAAYLIR